MTGKVSETCTNQKKHIHKMKHKNIGSDHPGSHHLPMCIALTASLLGWTKPARAYVPQAQCGQLIKCLLGRHFPLKILSLEKKQDNTFH